MEATTLLVIGAVIVLGIAIAGVSVIRRAATIEPALINREQPLISTRKARRLSDRQHLTDTFFRTGAIDRVGRSWTDATIRPEHHRDRQLHPPALVRGYQPSFGMVSTN
jgi:hypothetical protein